MSQAADLARAALARGDLIAAFDVTVSAIADGDGSSAVRHQQVLALARMGDTERAMERFAAYRLGESPHAHERAVGARLLKDRALSLAPGAARSDALRAAHEAYLTVYRESGDSFPGINAASLALLAGGEPCARPLAGAVAADPAAGAAAGYYAPAPRGAALIPLGRIDQAVG